MVKIAALPYTVLHEIMQNPWPSEEHPRIVFAVADAETQTIQFVTDACRYGSVPYSFFTPNDALVPDFAKLRITDYGQTLAMGAYECGSELLATYVEGDVTENGFADTPQIASETPKDAPTEAAS